MIKILFKNFMYEWWEQYFKLELYLFTKAKNNCLENFCPVLTHWLVRIWTYKMRMKKNRTYFFREETNTNKNRQKRTKNGYCVDPP